MTKIYIPRRSEALDEAFFARPSESVARDLLGRTLVRERNGATLYAKIQELAVWDGDKNHMRKETLSAPGTLIVFTSYAQKVFGISTDDIGKPSCVILRAATVGDKKGIGEYVEGTGMISEALDIDKDYNGLPLRHSPLWIGGQSVDENEILIRIKSKLPKNCKGYFYIK